MMWKAYSREKLFESYGKKNVYYDPKCFMCEETKNLRHNKETGRLFCINHFDKYMFVHPNGLEWLDIVTTKKRTFNEWLEHIKRFNTINSPEKPNTEI
jgi:hypothetical protein